MDEIDHNDAMRWLTTEIDRGGHRQIKTLGTFFGMTIKGCELELRRMTVLARGSK